MANPFLIYVIGFLCGAANMAIELTSVRFLAPYLGASMQTWAIVIVITLVSMSLGNWIGGKRADTEDPENVLGSMMLKAALWVGVVPVVGRHLVIAGMPLLLLVAPDLFLPLATVVFSVAVFAYPCYALGMATPNLVKLGVRAMESNGATTGTIYALSTLGSVIGTLVPTFLTIPLIGTNKTFLGISLLLVLLSLWLGAQKQRISLKDATTPVILGLLLFGPFTFPFAFWGGNIHEGESMYQYLQVVQDNGNTYFSTHVLVGRQSAYYSQNQLSGEYWEKALPALYFLPPNIRTGPAKILMIGFGAGTFAKLCKRFFPDARIEGVEIDGRVVDLARRFFDSAGNDATVFVEDGRTFLQRQPAEKYDFIFLDAFRDINIPFHLTSQEFFALARSKLKPQGVILLNVNMRGKDESDLAGHLGQTLKTLMKKVYRYDLANSLNTFVLATNNETALDLFLETIRTSGAPDALMPFLGELQTQTREIRDSRLVLTDDWAPIERFEQEMQESLFHDAFRELMVRVIAGLRTWYP